MKTLKKLLCIALAFAFMAVPVYAANDTKSFPDVPENNWAYKYVKDLTEAGVINGFPDGTFRPKNEITYDEFAALAVRACEAFDADTLREKYNKETVEGYNWASIYHFYARDNNFYAWEDALGGIFEGIAIDGNKPCTRADAAAIISDILVEDRGLNLDVMLLSNLEDAYHDSISELFGNPYEDWAGTDKYNDDLEYRTEYAVVNTIAHGIINGYSDATFRGDNKITREEAAAMIWRLIYTDYAPGATALTYEEYIKQNSNYQNYKIQVRNKKYSNNKYNNEESIAWVNDKLPSVIGGNTSELEKAKSIARYIMSYMTYDYSLYNNGIKTVSIQKNAPIISEKYGVCQDYADKFMIFCTEAGLDCSVESGKANNGSGWEGHAWNIITCDGKKYYFDVTWADCMQDQGAGITEVNKYLAATALWDDHILDNMIQCLSYNGKEGYVDKKNANSFFYDDAWMYFYNRQDIEELMLYFVNFERKAEGLSELELSDKLIDMAMFKAADMTTNNYFSHISDKYAGDFAKLCEQYIPMATNKAESICNVSSTLTTLADILNAWMDETSDRNNILSSKMKYLGFGYDGNYFVLEFSDVIN